mgnify:FL=1
MDKVSRRTKSMPPKRSKMTDFRINKLSRGTNILGRFTYLRMITIHNIKGGARRKSKSFMVKRCYDI